MYPSHIGLAVAVTLIFVPAANAAETVMDRISLPGASLEQEVTYHPSKREYVSTRNALLERMKRGDQSAFVNSRTGPWMVVSTTAMIGIEFRGVGASSGRKHLRQISAAEEALYIYDKWKAEN
jgi:hypothetical protein